MGKKSKGSGGTLLAFGSATLTGDQDGFIQKYIDKKYYLAKKKARQAQVELYHDRVVRKLEELEGIIGEMGPLITNKEQYDIVADLKMKRGSVLNGIGTSASSIKEAAEKLVTADSKLDGLISEADGLRSKFTTVDGTESDVRTAIKKLRVEAQGQLNALRNSWSVGVDVLRQEMAKVAPDKVFMVPKDADLTIKHKEHSGALRAAPSKAEASIEEARTEFDAIVALMRTDLQTARTALDAYAGSGFKEDLANSKLYQEASDAIEGLGTILEKLERWEVDGVAAYSKEIDTLAQRLDTAFSSGKPGSEVNTEAETIKSEAAALKTRMDKAVSDAEGAFAKTQAQLLKAFNVLKGRMDALGKSAIPADQRAPIDAFLAATHASITKLGGSNEDALKAARIMLEEAIVMVKQAEEIGPLNDEVKANIERAKATLKPLVKDKSPVSEPAKELQTKVETFEGEWLKKAPDDALKDARGLSTQAIDLESQNTTLMRLRALMDARIKDLEAKYKSFNDKFKEMLTWQGTADVRDYRGPIRSEIDGVITWNQTKMDIGFYSTISARIDTLTKQMDERIADIDNAMKSTPAALADAALAARDAYEKELFGLQLEAGASGQIDEAAAAKAKALYDEAMRINAVHTDLSQDLLEEERKESVNKLNREKFLTDGKKWVKDTNDALKAANEGEPFVTFKDEVERQITRIEATMKAADKDKLGPTGTQGLAELKEVERAVERIAARGSTTAKDKLGEIPGKWQDAVGEFRKSVNSLVPAVEDFEKSMNMSADASKALDGVLDEVVKRLTNTQLDSPAAILGASNPPKPAQERKAAREAALSEVRRLKKLLLEDPVIKAGVANPFGVQGFANSTIAQLEQIELDVLRGA